MKKQSNSTRKIQRTYQFGAITAQVMIWLLKITSFSVVFWVFAAIFQQ